MCSLSHFHRAGSHLQSSGHLSATELEIDFFVRGVQENLPIRPSSLNAHYDGRISATSGRYQPGLYTIVDTIDAAHDGRYITRPRLNNLLLNGPILHNADPRFRRIGGRLHLTTTPNRVSGNG